MLVLVIYDELM